MDSLIGFLVLLGIFYFLVLPIMVFIAFSRASVLTQQFNQLSLELEQSKGAGLEKQPLLIEPPIEENIKASVTSPVLMPKVVNPVITPLLNEVTTSEIVKPDEALKTESLEFVVSEPSSLELWIKKGINWFIKDNPLAKVGILILFFGIGYLVKYSIDNAIFPIELRLFSAVVISVGLLVFGWCLRHKNSKFSLILQGGSIGSLYIIILGTFRFFELIPAGLCFILLCIICFCCIVLALLQDARSLAIMALFGGFAAPILVSSGSGNYIALFSFYLLLSIVSVVLAGKKLWRELVYIAFITSCSIAGLWKMEHYLESDYLYCQFFIVANLALFGFVYPLWINKRIPLDYVILLSTPCLAFAMQCSIVSAEFGSAISAVGLSFIYLSLAYWAVHEQQRWDKMTRLCLLLLGISFLSLAVPLALSARWTSIFWSLEGLIVLHIGLSQKERYFQIGGLVLLVFALFPALHALQGFSVSMLSYLMTMAVLSLCWLAASYDWKKLASDQFNQDFYHNTQRMLLIASLSLWFIAILNLTNYFDSLSQIESFALSFALILASIACWWFISHHLTWQELSYSCLLLWPTIFLAMSCQHLLFHSIVDLGWYNLLWLVAFAMAWGVLRYNRALPKNEQWHLSLYWLTIGFILLNIMLVNHYDYKDYSWQQVEVIKTAAIIIVTSGAILLTLYAQTRNLWPVTVAPKMYTFVAMIPLVFILCVSMFFSLSISANDIAYSLVNLPYIPLFNIIDISVALGSLTFVYWLQNQQNNLTIYITRDKIVLIFLLMMAAFLNIMILRIVAFYADIVWSLGSLLRSDIIQLTLTFIWILFAVAIMLWANKHQQRRAWLAGISIIAVIVIKLFLIDSAQTSGIIRAAIFIAVALFILAISYYAPVPPKQQGEC